jgi:hypothetical protein
MIDSTMSSLLGQNIDLTQTQHQSLTNANVNVQQLLQTLQAQGVANSTADALNTPLTLTQLTNALDTTLTSAGNPTAADAVRALGTQVSGVNGTVTLSDLLKGETNASVLNQSSVNTLDLLNGVVATNNLNTSREAQTVNTTGSALGLDSKIGAVSLSVIVLEPAVFVCGPTGSKFYSASVRVKVHAALSNQGVNLNLNVGLNLATVKINLSALDLVVAVARAQGTITAINAMTAAVTVQATPGIAELYLGTISDDNLENRTRPINPTTDLGYASIGDVQVTLLGLTSTATLEARGYAIGTAPMASTLNFTGPYPQTLSATSSSNSISTLLTSLLNSLSVRLGTFVGGLNLGATLQPVIDLVTNSLKTAGGVLGGPLSGLLSSGVDPLLKQLGLGIGRVDVTVDRAPFAIPAGSACDDGEFCTENDICGANNVCAGTAKVCNDGLSCTNDSCDEANDKCAIAVPSGCAIGGACYAAAATNPTNSCQVCTPGTSTIAWTTLSQGDGCNDGKYCTVGDTCNAMGVCTGQNRVCDDGLLCTLDTCTENNGGSCGSALTVGCAIGNACYLPGANNPSNSCQSCDPITSQTAWTNKANNTLCDDGLLCTENDRCDAAGNCKSTAKSCSDGVSCTLDTCNETLGTCSSAPPAGSCLIGGQCYANGTTNPANQCQVCSSAANTTGWSSKSNGTSCEDGLFCSVGDTCNGLGLCESGAARTTCNDGLSCTTDVCNPLTDACDTVVATGCNIAGVCVAANADNPNNPCQYCNTLNPTAWTSKLVGTLCSDGLYCTTGDACNLAGVCLGTELVCPSSGGCNRGVCDEDNDVCGAPVPGCSIGLVLPTCYAEGAANPLNPCEVCRAAENDTDWSAIAAGDSCNDGEFCTEDDKCNAQGQCRGTQKTCAPTNNGCTSNACDELSHNCEPSLALGCLIDSACLPGGAVNPDNPCMRCDPLNPLAWSVLADATSCDDGLFCTDNDTCLAGVCAGAPKPCGTGLGCAIGACNEQTDACDVTISGCVIDNTCYAALQPNPANPCQVCDPGTSDSAWSPRPAGTLCSDSLFCTTEEQCDGVGGCGVQLNSCDDGFGCTVDICNESTRSCSSSSLTACVIDGLGCVAADTVNPNNSCESCQPGLTGWAAMAQGTACQDGQACTSGDACAAGGVCVGQPLSCSQDLASCADNTCDEAAGACKLDVLLGCVIGNACVAADTEEPGNPCRACIPSISVLEYSNRPVGALCTDGQFCTNDACNGAGLCLSTARDCNDNLGCTTDTCDEDNDRCDSTPPTGCVIAGQCFAAGVANPLSDCMTCDPSESTVGWTNKPAGSDCQGDTYCLVERQCNNMGVCVGGTLRDCSDDAACSTDRCDEGAKECTHSFVDGCVINGVCVLADFVNADNDCQVCDPILAPEAWSTVQNDRCLGEEDPDEDGLPTSRECPTGIVMCPDSDEDGKPDYMDEDDDADTVFTKYELGSGGGGSPRDTDTDGKLDYLDTDDDNDSIETRNEAPDPNIDGNPDDARDTDEDDKPDFLDDDDDDDTILTKQEREDSVEWGGNKDDLDGDGLDNWLDTDSDDDTYSDEVESRGTGDLNNDSKPDYLQNDVPGPDAGVGGSGGTGARGGSDAVGGAGSGAAATGGIGASGGNGGSGANSGRGGRGGSTAPPSDGGTREDAGGVPNDAGTDQDASMSTGDTDAAVETPDSGITQPPKDAGRADPLARGGFAGGSRCNVTQQSTGAPDLSVWFLSIVGGLLVWRRRRV